MINTMKLKAIGESKVAHELCKKNIPLYKPFIDDCGVDFIIDNKKLLKVQVKCCNKIQENGTYLVQLASVGYNRTQEKCKIKVSSSKDVDLYAIYFYDIDTVCYFRVKDYENKRHLHIRPKCNPTKNNQKYNTTWIEDHLEIPDL